MVCIDKKLINEELMDSRSVLGLTFTYKKLSKKYLDWLFRHYYVREIVENFYDSEPDFDEEEFNMYMDYPSCEKLSCLAIWNIVSNIDEIAKQKSKFKYSKEYHTIEELKNAYNKVNQMYKDYEKIRIEKLTWQEPYFEGNWGMTQRKVDSFGRYFINKIRKYSKSIKDRLYISEGKNEIQIYFYGRDVWEKDYWFTFIRKNKNVRGEKIVYRDIKGY